MYFGVLLRTYDLKCNLGALSRLSIRILVVHPALQERPRKALAVKAFEATNALDLSDVGWPSRTPLFRAPKLPIWTVNPSVCPQGRDGNSKAHFRKTRISHLKVNIPMYPSDESWLKNNFNPQSLWETRIQNCTFSQKGSFLGLLNPRLLLLFPSSHSLSSDLDLRWTTFIIPRPCNQCQLLPCHDLALRRTFAFVSRQTKERRGRQNHIFSDLKFR